MYNNANVVAVGFSLEHLEYKNIVFHSQPFGFGVEGQGIIVNVKILRWKNGISGELKHFMRRMQLSNEIQKLAWTQQATLEIVTKSWLPTISLFGPDAVAIFSHMRPDMEEIKKVLLSYNRRVFTRFLSYKRS